VAKKKTASPALMTIPVAFGDVGVGDQIARLGVSIDRKRLTLAQADKLCGKRLVGSITAVAGNDNPEQEGLPGMEDAGTTLDAAFDVKRIGFGPKSMSTSLSFAISSIALPVLCAFAKRAGTLEIQDITDIPADAPKEKGDDD
jgi:hypothetical protein